MFQLIEAAVQRDLPGPGNPDLVLQSVDDLVDLALYLALNIGEFGLGADHPRMPVAEFLVELGHFSPAFRLLLRELLDDRRLQHVARRVGSAGRSNQLTHLAQARFRLGAGRAHRDKLRVEIGDLLRDQSAALALQQSRLAPELLDRLLRRGDALAQVGDLVGQPLRSALRRVVLRLKLVENVQFGDLVRHLRGALCILRMEGNADHPRLRQQIDIQGFEKVVDDIRPFQHESDFR